MYEVNNVMGLLQTELTVKRFWIEFRKTKTKIITMAKQNKDKYHKETMITQSTTHLNGLKSGKTGE